MSRENVEVVRAFNAPGEGEDLAPVIREALARLGPHPQPEAVLAGWAEDPAWQHVHPDIEWDASALGALGTVAHGPREVVEWWTDGVNAWESYVYRTLSYRDLGRWVLQPVHVQARSREGASVEMVVFQLWLVRDGRIAVYRAFLSEREALEAAGLSE